MPTKPRCTFQRRSPLAKPAPTSLVYSATVMPVASLLKRAALALAASSPFALGLRTVMTQLEPQCLGATLGPPLVPPCSLAIGCTGGVARMACAVVTGTTGAGAA